MTAPPAKKAKGLNRLRRLILLLPLAALIYAAAFLGAIHLSGRSDNSENADAIIVLGAGLRRDGRPGWALTRRSQHAAKLWNAGIAPYVICTGARADGMPRSEARACSEILQRQGVQAAAILLEESSHSTEESAIHSRRLLAGRGLSRVVLVSDSYHMLRASWIYGRRELRVSSSPVPASQIQQPLFYEYSLLREFAAFHWHLLKEAINLPVTHVPGI